ncbi:MAG: right-handed parallel beta-helix repeat-containing protein [Phycisphaerae bacterium]|nr:right-handed parallel beta-helix repeat-containing protein [Phycisphaerales bacterium]
MNKINATAYRLRQSARRMNRIAFSVSLLLSMLLVHIARADDCNSNGVPDEVEVSAGVQRLTVAAPDGGLEDEFGIGVAVDNHRVVVGARYGESNSVDTSGAAYVYSIVGGYWQFEGKLLADTSVAGDAFGFSVAIDGMTAVVGAPFDDTAAPNGGAALVFRESGGTWEQVGRLTGNDTVDGDHFGVSVGISGDTIIVGADLEDGAEESTGAAYVFKEVGGIWQQQSKLTADDAAELDYFGRSVAIDGDTIVVGAYNSKKGAINFCGAAYVFKETGGIWSQEAKLSASDAGSVDRFAASVAIEGETIVVGAYRTDATETDSGSVYIFEESAGSWTEVIQLRSAAPAFTAYFGYSVAISGDLVAIGARGDIANGIKSGAAHVSKKFDGVWQPPFKVNADGALDDDWVGFSVALDGESLLVGAPHADGIESDIGFVHVFDLGFPDCNSNGVIDECDLESGAEDDCNLNGIPDVCEPFGANSQDCSHLDGDCVVGVCDLELAICDVQPANDGAACDDGDVCTLVDTCVAGVCFGTTLEVGSNGLPPECEVVVFVDGSATSGLNNGTSWSDAYVNLQDALHAASLNVGIYEIWVAAGTYKPDQGGGQTPGDQTATFVLRNDLAIYGGFVGGETSVDQRDHLANVTILEGDLLGDDPRMACVTQSDCGADGGYCTGGACVLGSYIGDNSERLLTGSYTDESAVLDGFVVQGGISTQNTQVCGIYNYSGSPTIRNCVFKGGFGASMYNIYSSPTVSNCVFSGEFSAYGEGMRNRFSSNPRIDNCLFVDNTNDGMINEQGCSPQVTNCIFRENYGSGISNRYESSPTILNCQFIRNSANSGGGIYNWEDSSPSITNCSFIENTASKGGAMDNHYGSVPIVTNCLFVGNEGSDGGAIFNDIASPQFINCTFYRNRSTWHDGGALRNQNNSHAVLTNCIVRGNTPDQIASVSSAPVVNHSIVQGGWAGAGSVGNLDVDPMFVDTNGPDNIPGTEDDDLRLQPGSPAVDAGDSAAVPAGIVTDLGEAERFADDINTPDTGVGPVPIVDMGAYEFQAKTVLYVDDDAIAGANDGSSWADAYVYLQDALLDASTNGVTSQIWVAAGTYKPDQGGWQTPGDRSATFQLQSGLVIYGGFVGNESVLSQRDHESNVTILSGDLFGDDLPDFGNDGENSLHVVTGSGTDATAMLSGFVVTAGNANSPSNYYGGGMYNESGSPTLEHCRFQHNFADGESNSIFYFGGGAGMANDGSSPRVISCAFFENASRGRGPGMCNFNQSSPLIENCEFRGNQLFSDVTSNPFGGAGIHNDGSNPSVTNCVFIDNRGGEAGGMCNNQGSGPTVTNCVFTGNRPGGLANRSNSNPIILNCRFVANVGGGSLAAGVSNSTSHPSVINCSFFGSSFAGMSNTSSDPTVANCVFAGNGTASLGGGGMFNLESSPIVTNCTFSENIIGGFGVSGGGMLNLSGSNPTITNCVMWCSAFDQVVSLNSNPVVNHCVIQGGWDGAGGVGIIDAKPMFVNSSGVDNVIGTEDDDLRLLPNSPAIDAGDNSAVPVDVLTDLDGHARFVDDVTTADTGVGVAPIVDVGAYEFVLGDCDADGDTDLDDHVILGGCLTNPGASLGVGCACLDLDSDGDVDLRDFALFQRTFFN